MARKYLLSIDGGGIRGILPAAALVKLEQTTGRLVRETVSFTAGTSTGAIIAGGIAAGLPAARILNLYLTRTPEIFAKHFWNEVERFTLGALYSTQKLHGIIAGEFGPARDWKINDSPIDLLITAKRVSDGMPWYFVRDKSTNAGCTGRLGLVDCVTASAAAPTYFDPWTIREDAATRPAQCEPVGRLVDGGVGVTGNPVYQACVEAFYYDVYKPEETTVISFGTGRFPGLTNPTGFIGWLEWILRELLQSPGEQQTEIVRRHFPNMLFYRLDPDLKALDPTLEHDIPLDDVSSIERLRLMGERFADQIDWNGILNGTDTKFLVTENNTLPAQYSKAVQ